MPFSLINGLSALGAGVAQFAGAAGLEQQKADLGERQLRLADQLATTRESFGRQEAGQIAATAAGEQRGYESGEHALDRSARSADIATTEAGADRRQVVSEAGQNTRQAASEAGANTRNAASVGAQYAQIAAGDETRAQEILASRAKVAFEAVQTQNAQDLQTAHKALQAEIGKPDADPAQIAALKSQVTSLETSAATEAATTSAAAAMYRTDMDAVQHYNTQLVTATSALNAPEMTDADRTAQKGLIADLKRQLAGAQRSLAYSSELVHGRVGSQTGGTPPSTGGNRPPLSSFSGGQPLPNPRAGPRAVPAPAIPGFLDGGY